MKIDRTNPRHWLLLLGQGVLTLVIILLRPFLQRQGPPLIVLYGHQLSGNLGALYREWSKTYGADLDMVFLSLDPAYSEKLERDGVPVLRCFRLGDMARVARAAAVITDHGLHLMSPLTRLTDIDFIDVWHGIPFKGFIPKDFRLQHRYDEVWVSSPLLKELYVERFGFQPERVIDIGYARTDRLFNPDAEQTGSGASQLMPGGSIVLYAPTWQQDDSGRELFPFGLKEKEFIGEVSAVCARSGATLVLRSHINASMEGRDMTNVMYCLQKDFPDTEEILVASDILICDWSSIAFDFLALRRPTIFLDVPTPFRNGFSLDASYRFGRIAGDFATLCQALSTYLEDPDRYQTEFGGKQEEVIRAVYAQNADGHCARRQLDRLVEKYTRPKA